MPKNNLILIHLFILLFPVFICLNGAARAARPVTDEAGRSVLLPVRSERIVSLAPSITEILFALGAGERLAGVSRFSNYPPEAKSLPRVGAYPSPSLERILMLRPDLVIGIRDGNPKVVVDRLTELGIPTYIVDPRDLDGVIESIRHIGLIIGAEAAADRLARNMSERIRKVRQKVKGLSRPRVFFQIGVDPVISAGKGTFVHTLIEVAGGRNITGETAGYPHVGVETVLISRPEVIVITSMAREASFERVRDFWRKWDEIPAVAADRIHIIDSDICDRPSPRIVLGLERLARLIHPEAFPACNSSRGKRIFLQIASCICSQGTADARRRARRRTDDTSSTRQRSRCGTL